MQQPRNNFDKTYSCMDIHKHHFINNTTLKFWATAVKQQASLVISKIDVISW